MAKQRIVYFSDCDNNIYEYSKSITNFSKWVKHKLEHERDIGSIEDLVNRLIDERLGKNAVVVNNNDDLNQFL